MTQLEDRVRCYLPDRFDVTARGNWQRFYIRRRGRDRFYYYWRRVRVPWVAWAMFS